MILVALSLSACTPDLPRGNDSALSDTGPFAVVATTDFSVGALARVDLESWAVADTLTATSADPSLVADAGWLFQINGYNVDTFRVYEPDNLRIPVAEVSTGAGTNPHDVDVCGDRLFVSLYETTRISMYATDDWSEVGAVDLTHWADTDGLPEVSSLVELNGVLYAALEHFNRDDGWTSTEGEVLQIDCETGEVTQSWQVGQSPRLFAHPTRPEALLVLTGVYWEADGAVTILDTTEGLEPEPMLAESEVQMDLVSLATSSGGEMVLITAGFESGSALVCLDTEGDWNVIAESASWYARIATSPFGEAWVSARPTPEDPSHGLWRVDIASCTLQAENPFTFALPPYGVAFPN